MKKQKMMIVILVILVLIISPFLVVKFTKVINDKRITSSIDFIEVPSRGEKIYIKSIETIEPTIWKGSYDGILHYKDGRQVEIIISQYGNFYGIKGEEHGLFSNGVLYHYEVK